MAKEYFTHDYSARNDVKLRQVDRLYGKAGIGVYWCLVEMIYEAGGEIPADVDLLAYDLRVKKPLVQGVIDICFDVTPDGKLSCESIQRRLNERKTKSEKAREMNAARWGERTPQESDKESTEGGVRNPQNENAESTRTPQGEFMESIKASEGIHKSKTSKKETEKAEEEKRTKKEEEEKDKEKERGRGEKGAQDSTKESVRCSQELAPPPSPAIDPKVLAKYLGAYNAICKALPSASMTIKRRGMIGRFAGLYDFASYESGLRKIAASGFLAGNNPRGWRATFDWIIDPDNFQRVMEGAYDDANYHPPQGDPEAATRKSFDSEDFFRKAVAKSRGAV